MLCNHGAKEIVELSNKIISCQIFFFNIAIWWCKWKKKNRNNDKLEPVRDIFSIWNQYYKVDMFQVDAW